jgi:hypothetical protein
MAWPVLFGIRYPISADLLVGEERRSEWKLLVIASEMKRSSFSSSTPKLDCFVATLLAMTALPIFVQDDWRRRAWRARTCENARR